MEKRDIGTETYVYPMPMVVVGADVDGKANFMPVAWVTRVRANEPWIAVAMGKTHLTNQGIHRHGEFGISVPSEDQLVTVDHCGLVSGRREDKSECFGVHRGKLEHAPMAAQCPLTLECRVVRTVDLESNELFVGEILASWTTDDYLTDGRVDAGKLRPFMLTMPDNRYWKLGDAIGHAWADGKRWPAE